MLRGHMLRGLKRRLDRLWAEHQRAAESRDDEDSRLEMRATVAKVIRAGLIHNGIDPDGVPALRRLERPEPAPHAVGARPPPGPLEAFNDRMRTLARRVRQHPPELAEATPVELFAVFCFDDGEAG